MRSYYIRNFGSKFDIHSWGFAVKTNAVGLVWTALLGSRDGQRWSEAFFALSCALIDIFATRVEHACQSGRSLNALVSRLVSTTGRGLLLGYATGRGILQVFVKGVR